MFCLRSWLPLLFFLTNASPVYLVLFISATYYLNRPCVYCSLLLAILVLALFDFNTSWFEPNSKYHEHSANETASNSSLALDVAMETASVVASTLNDTAGALVSAAMDGMKRRRVPEVNISGNGLEWGKALLKKEWKLPCLDVVVRL
ncbi:uncharacterized protein K452DRAFT_242648 [Aplosporella prunicola CBS 121167]|uniref:Uncharacterized protein n=1 Tax=Aplosporella prunicola CBS 121167 TaxID=1176127 RepID=A0A6A6BS39_9PEZI|nr:uncharacterized protein K452DRAFT_242648 [Aplosporella prunicola CBS 121167]KAF2146105.1 hypothetical protein K452DRAFT_242648 [Aplosporella prunicola CBS 121167]